MPTWLAWPQAADLNKLEPECLDLGEDTVKLGLVGEQARQHGVVTLRLGPERGERGTQCLA